MSKLWWEWGIRLRRIVIHPACQLYTHFSSNLHRPLTHLTRYTYSLSSFSAMHFFPMFSKASATRPATALHHSTWGVRRLLCRDYSDNRCPGFGSLLQGYQALVPAHASKYLRHHLCLKAAVLSPPWRSLGRLSLLCAFRDNAFLATLMF